MREIAQSRHNRLDGESRQWLCRRLPVASPRSARDRQADDVRSDLARQPRIGRTGRNSEIHQLLIDQTRRIPASTDSISEVDIFGPTQNRSQNVNPNPLKCLIKNRALRASAQFCITPSLDHELVWFGA